MWRWRVSVASCRKWCPVLSGQLPFCARGGEVGWGGRWWSRETSVIRLAWDLVPGAASPHVCKGSPGWDGEDSAQEKGARRGCFNRVVTPRCGLFLPLLPPACNLGAVRSSLCKSSWESEVDGLTEPRRRQAWNIAGGWGNWGSPSSSTGQLCFTSCFGELLSHCLTNLHFHRKSQKGYPALSRSLPDLTSHSFCHVADAPIKQKIWKGPFGLDGRKPSLGFASEDVTKEGSHQVAVAGFTQWRHQASFAMGLGAGRGSSSLSPGALAAADCQNWACPPAQRIYVLPSPCSYWVALPLPQQEGCAGTENLS